MRRFAHFSLIGLIVVGLSACSSVLVEEPVGTRVADLDPEEWAGSWATGSGEVFVVRPREEPGTAWLGRVEEGRGEPRLINTVAHVREAGDGEHSKWLVSVEGEPGEPHFWALLVLNGDTGAIYIPDPDAFRTLVAEGSLPGRFDEHQWGSEVYLGALQPQHVELILADEGGRLFRWDEPEVVRRVGR